jgi:hypothetical protein
MFQKRQRPLRSLERVTSLQCHSHVFLATLMVDFPIDVRLLALFVCIQPSLRFETQYFVSGTLTLITPGTHFVPSALMCCATESHVFNSIPNI